MVIVIWEQLEENSKRHHENIGGCGDLASGIIQV
jgi:hypothetical protein